MNILAVLSKNTAQCPKTLFICLLYIYTFPIASFWFCVQWIDLGSKKTLKLTHSGYQDNRIFGTKVWGGSLHFNLNSIKAHDSGSCFIKPYILNILFDKIYFGAWLNKIGILFQFFTLKVKFHITSDVNPLFHTLRHSVFKFNLDQFSSKLKYIFFFMFYMPKLGRHAYVIEFKILLHLLGQGIA